MLAIDWKVELNWGWALKRAPHENSMVERGPFGPVSAVTSTRLWQQHPAAV